MTRPCKPLQFGLGSLFGLMAGMGLLAAGLTGQDLWSLLALSAMALALAPPYFFPK